MGRPPADMQGTRATADITPDAPAAPAGMLAFVALLALCVARPSLRRWAANRRLLMAPAQDLPRRGMRRFGWAGVTWRAACRGPTAATPPLPTPSQPHPERLDVKPHPPPPHRPTTPGVVVVSPCGTQACVGLTDVKRPPSARPRTPCTPRAAVVHVLVDAATGLSPAAMGAVYAEAVAGGQSRLPPSAGAGAAGQAPTPPPRPAPAGSVDGSVPSGELH